MTNKRIFSENLIRSSIENKAEINLADSNNTTPIFHLLKSEQKHNLVRYFLENKARLDIKNSNFFINFLLFYKTYKVSNQYPLNLLYHGLNENLFVALAIQPEYSLKLKKSVTIKLQKLYEEYKKGTLWKPKRNGLFPQQFKNNVFHILVAFKIISKKYFILIPKPIIYMIIQFTTLVNKDAITLDL